MEFDATLKEFFQQQPTNLLLELTGGVPVVEFLKVELRRVQERRLDLVLLLEAVHRSPMAGLSNPRFAANDSVPAAACRSWVLPLRATLGALHQAFGKDLHLQAADHARHTETGGWPLAHSPSPRHRPQYGRSHPSE